MTQNNQQAKKKSPRTHPNSSVHQLTAKDGDQTGHKAGGSRQEQQKGFLS